MTKIKICGLFRIEDIDVVNEVLPDYIGFVFAKSKRQVNETVARELKAKLNPVIKAAGVFVNEDMDRIIHLCNAGTIDLIQLHGDENEDYIRKLRSSVINPIIKAVRVRAAEDITKASVIPYDYLLLDTYREEQYGGSGEAFDWSMITEVRKPFFLAGGIDIGNVIQAITIAQPYCIDVSSGVETDGRKDRTKIHDIVTKVRSVHALQSQSCYEV
jgi:phosphoribosylanthranilate isomerase